MHQPDGVGSKRYHIVLFGEFNGVPVAFVARFGVISKSTDRILSPMEINENELQTVGTKKR